MYINQPSSGSILTVYPDLDDELTVFTSDSFKYF
jgi:hypothetical protein